MNDACRTGPDGPRESEALCCLTDPAAELKAVVESYEIVFALFPDTSERGWDLHIIKGKPLIVDASDEELAKRSTTAVTCADLVEALAMEQAFGDGRPH